MIKERQETLNKAFNLSKKYEMENGDCAQCVFAGVTEAMRLLFWLFLWSCGCNGSPR